MTRRRADRPEAVADDPVGYGRPPKEHRFQDGHRGNPWGCKGKPKPKGAFLDERVPMTIEGRRRRVTRGEMLDYALFKEGLGGNVSAIKLLDERQRRARAEGPGDDETLSPADQEVFERFIRKAARRLGEPDEEEGEGGQDPGVEGTSDEEDEGEGHP